MPKQNGKRKHGTLVDAVLKYTEPPPIAVLKTLQGCGWDLEATADALGFGSTNSVINWAGRLMIAWAEYGDLNDEMFDTLRGCWKERMSDGRTIVGGRDHRRADVE